MRKIFYKIFKQIFKTEIEADLENRQADLKSKFAKGLEELQGKLIECEADMKKMTDDYLKMRKAWYLAETEKENYKRHWEQQQKDKETFGGNGEVEI